MKKDTEKSNAPALAVDDGSGLLRNPARAATYLATSLHHADVTCSKLRTMLDEATDEDVWQIVERVKEELTDLDAHFTGTSIGCAEDFGAWMTKDGWQPGKTHPLTEGYDDQNAKGQTRRREAPELSVPPGWASYFSAP